MVVYQTLNNKKSNFKSINICHLFELVEKTKDLQLLWVDFDNEEMYDILKESVPMNSFGKTMLQYKNDGYSSQRLFCENLKDKNDSIMFVHNTNDDYCENDISELISLIENNTQTKFVSENTINPTNDTYVN